jgi:hypothetical protein
MKKILTKSAHRSKGSGRRSRDDKPLELDRGWHELEQQADRLKSDWMSLAAQIGGQGKSAYD